MDIKFVEDLIYATKRCNDNENTNCGKCMYREHKSDRVYECIDVRAADTVKLLEEWIEEHKNGKKDN
jgi:hypothetical protein